MRTAPAERALSANPADPFASRVLAIVRRVPRGFVVTYGDVAAAAGAPRRARHVGRVLATLPSKQRDVPWQRVVGAGGRLAAACAAVQAKRLAREGVTVAKDRVREFEERRAPLALLRGTL